MDGVMFQKLRRNIERNLFGKDSHYEDPYEDLAEQFYARIYLQYLFEKIDLLFRHQQVRILDVGCHTGRLSIPLARAGHWVTGIDSSWFHVRRAQEHAEKEGVKCRFLKGNAFRLIRQMAPESFDLVLCTEVLYQCPDFREKMGELVKQVRRGGLLATSHRTRFFYLSKAIQEKKFEIAESILNHSEGLLWDSYFNWQTAAELKALYCDLGLEMVLMRPIGVFTGNRQEGMASLCNVPEISNEERAALFEIESHDSDEFSDLGRFLLAMGRKPGGEFA